MNFGVMGITNSLETQEILERGNFTDNKKLIAGILFNSRKKNSARHITTPEEAAKTLTSDPKVANFVKMDEEEDSGSAEKVVVAAGNALQGVVLPLWISIEEKVKDLKDTFPEIEILVEVSRQDIEDMGGEYLDLCCFLRKLRGSVDGVLLEGCYRDYPEFDGFFADNMIDHLLTQFPERRIGLVGISLEEIPKVEPLFRKYPGLGMIMEKGIRTKEDHLNLTSSAQYVETMENIRTL